MSRYLPLLLFLLGLSCVQRVPPPAAPAPSAPAPLAAAARPVPSPPPLAAVRDRLLPALSPADSGPDLLGREDLPGTRTLLVVASAGAVRGLPTTAPEAWRRSTDELFGLALENLAREEPLRFRTLRLDLGLEILAAQGEAPTLASHALLLDRHPEALGPFGALVAVPTRHHLLAYPIRDQRVTLAVQILPLLARRLHAAGPSPVTPNLYLYRKGRLVQVPYRLDAKGFALSPPPELLEILRTAPAAPRP